MKIRFQIDYRTQWGQEICVCGSSEELGGWKESKPLILRPTTGETWEGEVETADTEISYKYLIRDQGNDFMAWEHGDNRHLRVDGKRFSEVKVRDSWRSANDPENTLSTSPFLQAFFNRTTKQYKVKYKDGQSYLRLQLNAPRIGKDYAFGVLGDIKSLGAWDEQKLVLMSDEDFPIWKVDIPVGNEQLPFEYKFVVYSLKQKKVVTWENANNRYFPLTDFSDTSKLHVHTVEKFDYPVGNWKAAGVAIPVFSLRSKTGTGVGEFSDIKLLVDWSVKTGMKLVQILPVNDTVATHTWIDSYPYAAISVHALHPIFADQQAIGKLKDIKLQKEVDAERKRLNKLPEVDYEAVMKVKSRFFKASFDENKAVLKSEAFKTFFQENEDWLVPYAAFSYLRDKHGTPDFTQWGELKQVTPEELKTLCSPKAKHYADIAVHYYIQYYLDQQLKEACAYARQHGVVLKGDIPIGIYRNSVDAWLQPRLFNMDCQAGAPPDDFSISGQNWGFPTYNWKEMALDGFKWWRHRMVNMSKYFDVFRIDHILGFFRIWEIPWEHVEGIMGRFNPALPVHRNEFSDWGLYFDEMRFCKPYIRQHMVYDIFGNHAQTVFADYLLEYAPGCYALRPEFNTQRKVKEHFDILLQEQPEQFDFYSWIRNNLYRLLSEVLFLEAPLSSGQAFNPRIGFHATYSYQELDEDTKRKLDELYIHFFYSRHNDFWRDSALSKLPMLKEATNMLICGEDLGMVPASVPGVMDELSILSLAIQRMPNDDREFWHPSDTPYLSVTCTGSHDMSTLREWWQEDTDKTQRFYNSILGQNGGAPYYCEPWLAKDIINQHMHSPSMWAIFPLQDLVAMDGQLRRVFPEEERINVPAIAQHYWKYRFHMTMEDLLLQEDFNGLLRQMIDQGGRHADY
ncbi:MAG: 4-alpha-glucanotransferase [Cyclobacteriaceae bacterium]|nr:4-alpha-glucanotransferase [Cyclobacteriaceae bacterium HetDA_MAG_MS6]